MSGRASSPFGLTGPVANPHPEAAGRPEGLLPDRAERPPVLRRLLAVVAGAGLGVALVVGLARVVALRFALAAGAGVGTAVFLVADGSAGAGEGWIYHRVRSRRHRATDCLWAAGAGVGLGLSLAGVAVAVDLGRLGAALLVIVGALLGANLAFVYRRPDYEAALAEEA